MAHRVAVTHVRSGAKPADFYGRTSPRILARTAGGMQHGMLYPLRRARAAFAPFGDASDIRVVHSDVSAELSSVQCLNDLRSFLQCCCDGLAVDDSFLGLVLHGSLLGVVRGARFRNSAQPGVEEMTFCRWSTCSGRTKHLTHGMHCWALLEL